MSDRRTKQGVRDLNSSTGRNGRRHCRHWFAGPLIVIGERLGFNDIGMPVSKDVYGQRCAWCDETKEAY